MIVASNNQEQQTLEEGETDLQSFLNKYSNVHF